MVVGVVATTEEAVERSHPNRTIIAASSSRMRIRACFDNFAVEVIIDRDNNCVDSDDEDEPPPPSERTGGTLHWFFASPLSLVAVLPARVLLFEDELWEGVDVRLVAVGDEGSSFFTAMGCPAASAAAAAAAAARARSLALVYWLARPFLGGGGISLATVAEDAEGAAAVAASIGCVASVLLDGRRAPPASFKYDPDDVGVAPGAPPSSSSSNFTFVERRGSSLWCVVPERFRLRGGGAMVLVVALPLLVPPSATTA